MRPRPRQHQPRCHTSPPSQALLPYPQLQSMSACCDNCTSSPVCRKTCPSMLSAAPNDQHEPQMPWSLTAVTAPACVIVAISGWKGPKNGARGCHRWHTEACGVAS